MVTPGEYDFLQRRCGLMSNYFDHLLLLGKSGQKDMVSETYTV